MWLFNVTREMYRTSGLKVEPDPVPQTDEEMTQAARLALASEDSDRVWVLKVHMILKPDIPRSKIISVHRDPRDQLISFMEFTRSNFNDSLGCARTLLEYTGAYESYSPQYVMLAAYNDIETRPAELILRIAGFLGVPLDTNAAQEITLMFSRERVRRIIENNDAALRYKLASRQPVDPREMVRLSDSNYRAFDLRTGFQSGHISQRQAGDWKRILSDAEQGQLNEEFGDWLRRYGYEKVHRAQRLK
jgi:hypothetical protein